MLDYGFASVGKILADFALRLTPRNDREICFKGKIALIRLLRLTPCNDAAVESSVCLMIDCHDSANTESYNDKKPNYCAMCIAFLAPFIPRNDAVVGFMPLRDSILEAKNLKF